MIEQNSDYRLNNNLRNACNKDINQYCYDILGKFNNDLQAYIPYFSNSGKLYRICKCKKL